MIILKEIFDLWTCEVLELFNSLLDPEVTSGDQQIPLEKTEVDLLDLQRQWMIIQKLRISL